MCSQTFTLFRLIKTAVPVEISWYSFCVLACACPSVISSISDISLYIRYGTAYPKLVLGTPCLLTRVSELLDILVSASFNRSMQFQRKNMIFCCTWSHDLDQTSFMLVWQYHQLLSEFLANGHLPQVSHQSQLSANYKGDTGGYLNIFVLSVYSLLVRTEGPLSLRGPIARHHPALR